MHYALKIQAAISAGGWLLLANETGRTSCAFPPEPDGRLEAQPLYPAVFRASVRYQTHVRSRLLTPLIHLAMPSPSMGRAHGHESADRAPLASVGCFDQSGEQYGIAAPLTCGYKGYALYLRSFTSPLFFDANTDPPRLRSADFKPLRHRAPLRSS